MPFVIKEVSKSFEKASIQEVGFDSSYIDKVVGKYNFRLFKIFGLSSQQASILKQTALSLGTDCAVHREVITCKVDKTDVILGGSCEQIKRIAAKLKSQPFSLSKLAENLLSSLDDSLGLTTLRGKEFDWKKTYLMGILNVTPDSFSDGGKYFSCEEAINQAKYLSDYSDILDIGGESTRPGAFVVPAEEEVRRICPVIKGVRDAGVDIPISVDTRNSLTAREALLAGADIINDVSCGNWDPKMFEVAAEFQVPYILMHSVKTPENMQENPSYERIVDDIYLDLYSKIVRAIEAGIKKENIIIDVGIGFGKTFEQNFELLKRVSEFKSLGCPMLVGISRKSFLSSAEDLCLEEKDLATLSLSSFLVSQGVNVLRVHNPKLHKKFMGIIDRVSLPY